MPLIHIFACLFGLFAFAFTHIQLLIFKAETRSILSRSPTHAISLPLTLPSPPNYYYPFATPTSSQRGDPHIREAQADEVQEPHSERLTVVRLLRKFGLPHPRVELGDADAHLI